MNNINVIIIGRNYASLLGMIRAVGKTGCNVSVIKCVTEIPNNKSIKYAIKRIIIGKPIESRSKYVKKIIYTQANNREKLIKAIIDESKNIEGKAILIPTDDFSASTIDFNIDKLKDKFLFPNILNESGKIVELMNKDIQKQIAINSGLNISKGVIINKKNNTYNIPNEIIYPVFTKPQISFKGDKTFMKKCDNENELIDLLNSIPDEYDCPILAEQYIDIEKEYAILGCSFNGEIIMPGIIEMIQSGSGNHKGVTMIGKIKAFENNSILKNKLNKFIKSLNFNGLFDIDLFENNGTIYFNELNLRFGASGYAITKTGPNLPYIFINYFLNNKINQENIKMESTFVNEKVCLEDFENGYLTYNKYKNIIKTSDFGFIKSKEDPKPYIAFKRIELINIVKKLIRR